MTRSDVLHQKLVAVDPVNGYDAYQSLRSRLGWTALHNLSYGTPEEVIDLVTLHMYRVRFREAERQFEPSGNRITRMDVVRMKFQVVDSYYANEDVNFLQSKYCQQDIEKLYLAVPEEIIGIKSHIREMKRRDRDYCSVHVSFLGFIPERTVVQNYFRATTRDLSHVHSSGNFCIVYFKHVLTALDLIESGEVHSHLNYQFVVQPRGLRNVGESLEERMEDHFMLRLEPEAALRQKLSLITIQPEIAQRVHQHLFRNYGSLHVVEVLKGPLDVLVGYVRDVLHGIDLPQRLPSPVVGAYDPLAAFIDAEDRESE